MTPEQVCRACGKRKGFLGPKLSACMGCGGIYCSSCHDKSGWTIITGTHYFTKAAEAPVCSEECAFAAYSKNLLKVDTKDGVFLANESNSSVGVYGDRENEGFGISIAYMHVNAGKLSAGDQMGAEIQRLYSRIKADLDHKEIKYEEVFESVA